MMEKKEKPQPKKLETIALSMSNKEYFDNLRHNYKFKSMDNLFDVITLHLKEAMARGDLTFYNQGVKWGKKN